LDVGSLEAISPRLDIPKFNYNQTLISQGNWPHNEIAAKHSFPF